MSHIVGELDSVDGPCSSEWCGHPLCDIKRGIAESKCTACEKPIGYGIQYVEHPNNAKVEDYEDLRYTHIDCKNLTMEEGTIADGTSNQVEATEEEGSGGGETASRPQQRATGHRGVRRSQADGDEDHQSEDAHNSGEGSGGNRPQQSNSVHSSEEPGGEGHAGNGDDRRRDVHAPVGHEADPNSITRPTGPSEEDRGPGFNAITRIEFEEVETEPQKGTGEESSS